MIEIAGFGPESTRNSVRAASNAAENRRQERWARRIGRLAGRVSDGWAITMEGGEMAGAAGRIAARHRSGRSIAAEDSLRARGTRASTAAAAGDNCTVRGPVLVSGSRISPASRSTLSQRSDRLSFFWQPPRPGRRFSGARPEGNGLLRPARRGGPLKKKPWTVQVSYDAYFRVAVAFDAQTLQDAIPAVIRHADENERR